MVLRARSAVVPRIPIAPGEYSKQYMDLLVQALDQSFDTLGNPSVLRAGRLILNEFPENPQLLRVGEVFIDGGMLRVVRERDAFTSTNVLSSELGNVTTNVT